MSDCQRREECAKMARMIRKQELRIATVLFFSFVFCPRGNKAAEERRRREEERERERKERKKERKSPVADRNRPERDWLSKSKRRPARLDWPGHRNC